MLLELGLMSAAVAGTIGLLHWGRRGHARYRKERAGFEFVQKPLSDLGLGVGLAGGAAGISLAELYLASDRHEEVLKQLAYRFNRLVPQDATPFDWAPRFARWQADPSSLRGVESNIVGQVAESEAVRSWNEQLQGSGVTARLAESRTQEGHDIVFVNADGSLADLPAQQVKSYASLDGFLQQVRRDPQPHFTVNRELFDRLTASGKLEILEEQGVSIFNGGWSHEELTRQATELSIDMSEAVDLAEDVPVLSALFFAARAQRTIRERIAGRQSTCEAMVDFAGAAGRTATSGGGAVAGGKLVAFIGTMIAPGIGTVIGGGVGIVLGAWGAAKVWHKFKEWWKYGKLKTCLAAIGAAAAKELRPGGRLAQALTRDVYQLTQAREALETERKLASRYTPDEPGFYLARAGIEHYRRTITVLDGAAANLRRWICNLASEKFPDKTPSRLLGELVAANDVLAAALPEVDEHVTTYRQEMKKYPHHPWRFEAADVVLDSRDVLATAAYEQARRSAQRHQAARTYLWFNPWPVIAASAAALVGLWGIAIAASWSRWSDRSLHSRDLLLWVSVTLGTALIAGLGAFLLGSRRSTVSVHWPAEDRRPIISDIDSLPHPLAAPIRLAKSQSRPERRVKCLLHGIEAALRYVAMITISALREQGSQGIDDVLASRLRAFKGPISMGGWLDVLRKLAPLSKSLGDIRLTAVVDALCAGDKSLTHLEERIATAICWRNRWVHEMRIWSDARLRRRETELLDLVTDLLGALSPLRELRLVLVEEIRDLDDTGEGGLYSLLDASGPAEMFEAREEHISFRLRPGRTYMLRPGGRPVPLDGMMRIASCVQCGRLEVFVARSLVLGGTRRPTKLHGLLTGHAMMAG